jgi:hypothetical protein
MGTGINTVTRASKRGGFLQATKKDHIMGLISTALGTGDSDNPFQDLGLGEKMIFDPVDYTTFVPVKDRIREIFQNFETEELAALQERPDNLQIIETTEGEVAMTVYYVDLETDEKDEMSIVGNPSGIRVI